MSSAAGLCLGLSSARPSSERLSVQTVARPVVTGRQLAQNCQDSVCDCQLLNHCPCFQLGTTQQQSRACPPTNQGVTHFWQADP